MMRYLIRLAAVILTCTLTGAALAADPDPATPNGAQKVVRAAAEKGDKAEVRKFLHATTPVEEKLADAIADNAVAGAAAYKAAVAKFGEDETRKTLLGVVPIHPKESEEEKTEWKMEGDKATAVPTDKNKFTGPPLTKVDGIWKMSMSDVISGRPESEISQMITVLGQQSGMMDEWRKETEAGKYATAADLRKVALERMQAMYATMMKQATTRAAATKPAGK
jgi:hypothetical protein